MWQVLRVATSSTQWTCCPHHKACVTTAVPCLSLPPLASRVLGLGGNCCSALAPSGWLSHHGAGAGFGSPTALGVLSPMGWVSGQAQGHPPGHGGDTPDVRMAQGTLWWGCGDIDPGRQSCAL